MNVYRYIAVKHLYKIHSKSQFVHLCVYLDTLSSTGIALLEYELH